MKSGHFGGWIHSSASVDRLFSDFNPIWIIVWVMNVGGVLRGWKRAHQSINVEDSIRQHFEVVHCLEIRDVPVRSDATSFIHVIISI